MLRKLDEILDEIFEQLDDRSELFSSIERSLSILTRLVPDASDEVDQALALLNVAVSREAGVLESVGEPHEIIQNEWVNVMRKLSKLLEMTVDKDAVRQIRAARDLLKRSLGRTIARHPSGTRIIGDQ